MDKREPLRTALDLAGDLESREFAKLLDAEIRDDSDSKAHSIEGVIVGTLVCFQDNGATPFVTFPGQPGTAALPARTAVDLRAQHVGRDVVLMFETGDPTRPIIVGRLRKLGEASVADVTGRVEVDADGERLVVSANQGLVLRCGKSSITLSPDGKIVVRGAQVVSHASGLNRIKGGSVQIN